MFTLNPKIWCQLQTLEVHARVITRLPGWATLGPTSQRSPKLTLGAWLVTLSSQLAWVFFFMNTVYWFVTKQPWKTKLNIHQLIIEKNMKYPIKCMISHSRKWFICRWTRVGMRTEQSVEFCYAEYVSWYSTRLWTVFVVHISIEISDPILFT